MIYFLHNKIKEILFQVELLQEFAESETIALSGFQMFNLTKPSIMNVGKENLKKNHSLSSVIQTYTIFFFILQLIGTIISYVMVLATFNQRNDKFELSSINCP